MHIHHLFRAVLVSIAIAGMARADAPQAAIGAAAPAFSLQDQNGKTVSLSDYQGKVVVLEWTHPECPFVQRHYEAKTMQTLASKYASQGVVWLAINSTNSATNASNTAWATEQHISYPILNDSAGSVGHAYGAKTTPHMYVIDKTGKLVYMGAIDDDASGKKTQPTNYVAKALDEVLAGQPVSMAETKPYGCSVKYGK